MPTYDLRSDTLTRPSPAMRAQMAAAEVGDDVYGEDPSVQRLEAHVAELLGKEQALFVPSGTMGNQIALLVHCRPGDEVVVGEGAHCAWYESGAGAAWAGVQFAIAGRGGLFSAAEAELALKPRADVYPRSSLIVVENTHNRAGGRVFEFAEITRIAELARARGLALHMDGARLWNAALASGIDERTWAAPCDTLNVCFSKGLGAPVGSAFVGRADHVRAARRFRKMLGGGMRQAGVLAAAALYALEHQRERLAEDHANAGAFAEILAESPSVSLSAPETNIVVFSTPSLDAARVVQRAAERGVLVNAIGPHALRAVTHLDVDAHSTREAARLLVSALETLQSSNPASGS